MKTQNNCDLLYSKLIDRRNCISEYSKIKKCIPKDYLNFLKNENNDIDNKPKSRNKMKLLTNLKLTDIRGKIINTKDIKIKIIQKILNKKSLPKCQDKWNNVYNEEFHWPKIWNNLKRLDISNKIPQNNNKPIIIILVLDWEKFYTLGCVCNAALSIITYFVKTF